MNKKIIIWSLAFLLILINIDLVSATLTDNNVNGSKTLTRNVVITKNGRLNVYMKWTENNANNDPKARIWLEYDTNTTAGDDSDAANLTITASCGSNPFIVMNRSVLCPDSDAHCISDPNSAYKINVSTAATNQIFTWGIKSCNVSGVFDIGTDYDLLKGTVTLDNWFNITVASTLFSNITNSNSSYRKIYHINTSNPAANQTVNISVRITNQDDIKFHIFSTNVTGIWKNRTASNTRTSGSADTNIVNWTTLDINTSCAAAACTNTKKVGWRYYANDSSRLFNASAINIISPQAPVTDSCTPPGSGDWVITDTCYKSNENINLASGGRVLILAGGLLICDRANITAAGSTPIMIILGQSLTKLVSKGASNC